MGHAQTTHADSAPAPAQEGDLLTACRNGDVSLAASLVQSGVPLTGRDETGQTALMLAAAEHPEIVQILLAGKPDLNVRGPGGITALYLACAADNVASAQELIAAGADPDLPIANSRTALLAAVENSDTPLVSLLLQHHADPNQGYADGTPLSCAVSRDDVEIVAALLTAGAKANLPMTNTAGESMMTLVARAAVGNNVALIDLLLAHGANIEETDVKGITPLLWALMHAKAATVEHLLQKGADVNHADTKGDTPLMIAMLRQRQPIWQELLDHGAKIDAVNADGQSALIIAASLGDEPPCLFLIDNHADVDLVDQKGETALAYAGDRGQSPVVEALIDNGARKTDIHLIPKPAANPPLPAARRWELALAAIYDQVDGGNPNVLGGGLTPFRAVELLVRDWRIRDRAKLLHTIQALTYPGQRADFQSREGDVDQSNPNIAYVLRRGNRTRDRLDLIRKNYLTWQDRSGLAGDIARAAHLVNLGVASGLLSEAEAWPLLNAAAAQTAARFHSWNEYGTNFLDSREMWGGIDDPQFETCGHLLAEDPNSPWRQIAWDTPLGLTAWPGPNEPAPATRASAQWGIPSVSPVPPASSSGNGGDD